MDIECQEAQNSKGNHRRTSRQAIDIVEHGNRIGDIHDGENGHGHAKPPGHLEDAQDAMEIIEPKP